MVKIIGLGTLSKVFKEKNIAADTLKEALYIISEELPDALDSKENPSGNYIILLNGRDVRLFDKDMKIGTEDIIEIVPVSHGG